MTNITERLRADADRGWLHPGVADEAADEIERLRAQVAEAFADAKGRADVVLSEENDRLIDEIKRLHAALEIIAGRQQCMDNLMSNADIARAALNLGKS